MSGMRQTAKDNTGRRTIIIPDLGLGKLDFDRFNFYAAIDHVEMEELLNNWFQTKKKKL